MIKRWCWLLKIISSRRSLFPIRLKSEYADWISSTISNIVLPNNAILIAIYDDNDEMVIPHGDTVIEAGQNILAFGDENAIKELNKLFIG